MLVHSNICPRNDGTMDKYAMRKKTIMAVFNWLLFAVMFGACIVYVTPKPPPENCYMIGKDIKCFHNGTPFDNSNTLPEDPRDIPMIFRLYLKDQHVLKIAQVGDAEELQYVPSNETISRKFHTNTRTIFIVHGWHGNEYQDWIIRAKNRILAILPANVITVDWSAGADKSYYQAVANCRVAGAAVAHVMTELHEKYGTNYSSMHVIGWSLGAHVAGYAGEELKLKNNLLGRISGLDPAGLGFSGDGKKRVSLDRTDAAFVDVIHTDCFITDSGKGILEPIGHVDFYPNYGIRQPGCKDKRACDHARAPVYYVESIFPTCGFYSTPCPFSNIASGTGCSANCTTDCVRMGFYSGNGNDVPNGTFYLETNGVPPYCKV